MIKHSIAILAALIVVGAAHAGFIACPSNTKPVSNGEIYHKAWTVSVLSGKNIPIKVSYPGLVRTKVEGKPGLACYDDDKRADRVVDRPLYNVTFIYRFDCKNPVVDKKKNGFQCN